MFRYLLLNNKKDHLKMIRSDLLTLVEDVIQEVDDFKEISQHSFLTLYSLFSTSLVSALELVDKL